MKQFCLHADALYRSFFGRETNALYQKSTEPEVVSSERLALKVPRELLLNPSEFPPHAHPKFQSDTPHDSIAMGEPAPWRAAAGGWEQKGDFDPANCDGVITHRRANTKRQKPPTERIRPIEGLAPPRIKDAMKLKDSVSATAFAVATVTGCRFPMGDPKSSDFRFCNELRTHGSYCECHKKIVTFTL